MQSFCLSQKVLYDWLHQHDDALKQYIMKTSNEQLTRIQANELQNLAKTLTILENELQSIDPYLKLRELHERTRNYREFIQLILDMEVPDDPE